MNDSSTAKPARKRRRAILTPDSPRAQCVEVRAALTPTSGRAAYLKAAAGTASAGAAIKAFCFQCCGYDRKAVTDCTALACPLWAYRPFQPR